MANRATLDTNILLRFLLNDSPELEEKIIKFIVDSGKVFWIPDLAITEAVYVMGGEPSCFSRDKIRGMFGFIFDYPNFEYSKELFGRVFDLFVSHPKLSFNDCYLVCKAEEEEQLPFYTLDQKLAKQAGTAKLLPLS